jgi:hypothetical protein
VARVYRQATVHINPSGKAEQLPLSAYRIIAIFIRLNDVTGNDECDMRTIVFSKSEIYQLALCCFVMEFGGRADLK